MKLVIDTSELEGILMGALRDATNLPLQNMRIVTHGDDEIALSELVKHIVLEVDK